MHIAAMIFTLLAKIGIGVFLLLDMLKKKAVFYLFLLPGLGVLMIGDMLFMGNTKATTVIACILWILGWLGFGFGFVLMLRPALWKVFTGGGARAAAAAPAAAGPAPAPPPPAPPPAPPAPQ